MRWMKFSIGLFFTGVGILGAFLPVLPSTVFFITAAYYFSQSSEKTELWLLNHPRFGPPVVKWRKEKAISKPAKVLASGSITVSGVIIYLAELPLIASGFAFAVLIGSLAYILTRPS
jgi:uncharacterized membrane protein YbaN (DUF454 family)